MGIEKLFSFFKKSTLADEYKEHETIRANISVLGPDGKKYITPQQNVRGKDGELILFKDGVKYEVPMNEDSLKQYKIIKGK